MITPAEVNRQGQGRHQVPAWMAGTGSGSKKDAVITPGEQQRRVLAAAGLLTDITAWGWEQAPARRLIFPGDIPRLPKVLPRYLPVDADRRLGEALRDSPSRLPACAL